MNDIEKLIIIGSGPAGLTAGIYSSRANLNPLIIDGPNPGGQLMGTSYVENWPGEKSILGPELIMNMRSHAKEFGSRFLAENVESVNFSKKPFTITTNKNKTLKAHCVILATGASAKRLGCPGESKYWGKGVTTCAVCDGAFYKDKKVLVIGGGDTAMEDASFLTKFTNKIIVVHILDKLTASAPMQKRVLSNPNIKVIYNSTVTAFHGDESKVTKATIKNIKTNKEESLDIDGAFIAIGMNPNTHMLGNSVELDKFKYLIVKNHTNTSVEGVFAAGDVADYRYRQAITSAGSGCMAALDAERYLAKILD